MKVFKNRNKCPPVFDELKGISDTAINVDPAVIRAKITVALRPNLNKIMIEYYTSYI